jgi:hypothetical protein
MEKARESVRVLRLREALPQLNRTTEDWHTRLVTLSVTKGLSERCFASLSMTGPR